MTDSKSSSFDQFSENIEDLEEVDASLEADIMNNDNVSAIKSINKRQKNERRMDDLNLEKDLREFDFDI